MARLTIKELQERLKQANNVIDLQQRDIERLNDNLEKVKQKMNVINIEEFNGVVKDLERMKLQYKILKEQKDKEISKLVTRSQINKKSTHNERNAGRKEFNDYKTVKYIFDLYANGESLQTIANKLNTTNIKTRVGGTWAKSSVRFILHNKSYIEKGIIDEKVYNLITEHTKSNINKNSKEE